MVPDGAHLLRHLRASRALGYLQAEGTNLINSTSRTWSAPTSAWRQSLVQAQHLTLVQHLGLPVSDADAKPTQEERGIIDWFLVGYWGAVVLVVLVSVMVVQPWISGVEEKDPDGAISKEEFDPAASVASPAFGAVVEAVGSEQPEGGPSERVPSRQVSTGRNKEEMPNGPKEVELPRSMWSLNMVASIGQAKVCDKDISAVMVGAVTLFMASLQIFALFLVVHDIDPNAEPITTKPTSPWIKSGWSVNCMKWLMVTFLSTLMVTEAGDVRMIMTCILETNSSRLREPRVFLMSVCFFQYIILVFVIWGGVSAVLSFQSVPDILYSSMSITYIAKVDEAVFTMLYQVFHIEADFRVIHGNKVSKMTSEGLWSALDVDGDGNITKKEFHEFQDAQRRVILDEKLRPEKIPQVVGMLLHFLTAFPTLLGFALIGRAFYTNVMPTDRFHDLKRNLLWIISGKWS